MGFWGGLQILFIALKLCGVIGWSWWLVLSPSFFMAGVCFVVVCASAIKQAGK